METKLLYELSKEGKIGYSIPPLDTPASNFADMIPIEFQRQKVELPQVSEPEVVRHFTNLASKNFGVDTGFYPLGSCTMKYNPKINEELSKKEGFSNIHPLQDEATVQGALELMHNLTELLKEITGMDAYTLFPAAGAHGELTGMMITKKYFDSLGEGKKRRKILIPDSAHGTNPASAATVKYEIHTIKSTENGEVDLEDLRSNTDETVAALMLTNPNTLGIFERNIKDIAEIMHSKGCILYYDGANLNALLGYVRPGDMGFDIVHLNLHKTFSTPHGGGGPGAAPVGVKEYLAPYLPTPIVVKKNGKFYFSYDYPLSIGRMRLAGPNFSVLVKAYAYILTLGAKGLKDVSSQAVVNANYIRESLKDYYSQGNRNICMHECVLTAENYLKYGIKAKDICKRLIDYEFHPPTNYFPLIVQEALMIEPTETESKETIDAFIEAMIKIANEAKENPELLLEAPHNTPVRRPDEVKAARDLDLAYRIS
jgi:glycine dehydrogenase subunit 2